MTEEEEQNLVQCIGIDGKYHYKVVWKDTSICGMKTISDKKVDTECFRYCCIECDYTHDEIISGLEDDKKE